MSQELQECISNTVNEVYEQNEFFTKEELYNEYISQIEERDFKPMLNYLFSKHRKLWFQIIKLLKKEGIA